MRLPPAVIVHGAADVRAARAPGAPVTLLSAPGAALFAGCGWWRDLVRGTDVIDVLDCADASGLALGALRMGVCRLVLWPSAPNHAAVTVLAEQQGGFVLAEAPPALDLGLRGGRYHLHAWLLCSAGDRPPPLR